MLLSTFLKIFKKFSFWSKCDVTEWWIFGQRCDATTWTCSDVTATATRVVLRASLTMILIHYLKIPVKRQELSKRRWEKLICYIAIVLNYIDDILKYLYPSVKKLTKNFKHSSVLAYTNYIFM